MYIKKMSGFVTPETWNSRPHMYDKYGHISSVSYPQKNCMSKRERDFPPRSTAKSLPTELRDNSIHNELKEFFEKIGNSFLSRIQLDARAPYSLQSDFKVDIGHANSSFSDELAKITINIPDNDLIPENIILQTEPVMQQYGNRLADVIESYDRDFCSYLTLKELGNIGYDRYLYLSEKTASTCDDCENRHGQVYSIQDLGKGQMIPPVHPNCRCSLIAMNQNTEELYNADKQKLLDILEEKLYNFIGGIYQLNPDMELTYIPVSVPAAANIIDDSAYSKWYEKLRDWASNFGEDAKAALDAFYEDALRRSQNKFNDVPSFFDWLTFGISGGIYDSFAERADRMLQDPSVYNVANWLLIGIPDVVNGAINPDEPLSFDHIMSSLETATLLYGGYRVAQEAARSGIATVRPNQNNLIGEAQPKTRLDYTPTSGVKLEAIPDKTTTILGSYKYDTIKILNELEYSKGTDFGPRKGGFNLLNTPDELYIDKYQFWDKYNKPWLDNVINRKDVIVLSTKPTNSNLYTFNIDTGMRELTGFGREYEYLLANEYRYDFSSMQMIPK